MNILGMGPLEILLIVVIALIVFGPAKLPEIMGQVGRAIAEFRRMTSELSDDFNRTIQAELQETRSVVEDTRSAVTGVHTSINSALAGVTAPTLTTPAPTLTASPPSNGINGTNGTTNGVVQDKPPLADTAQWSWETAAPTPPKAAVEAVPDTSTGEPTATEQPMPATAEPQVQAVEPERKPRRRDDLLPPY